MLLTKGKALYQPWAEDDFMSDEVVRKMNSLQKWMYRSLCQQAFVCSTRPDLPDDDDALWGLAGCENKKQWLANREKTLLKFKKIEKSGKKLLRHKRIFSDWKREGDRRQTLRNNGSKGGIAKHKNILANAKATLKQGFSTELNCTELNRTELNGTEQMRQKQFDAVKHISKFLTARTKSAVNPSMSERSRLKALADTFGGTALCDAIDGYYSEHPNSNYVSNFLNSASAYLGKPEATGDTNQEELDNLNATIYTETGLTFSGVHRIALGKLRNQFSENQILEALRTFLDDPDRNVRYAAKDFAEGGGMAVLTALKREQANEVDTEQQLELINKQLAEKKRLETLQQQPVTEAVDPEDFL